MPPGTKGTQEEGRFCSDCFSSSLFAGDPSVMLKVTVGGWRCCTHVGVMPKAPPPSSASYQENLTRRVTASFFTGYFFFLEVKGRKTLFSGRQQASSDITKFPSFNSGFGGCLEAGGPAVIAF